MHRKHLVILALCAAAWAVLAAFLLPGRSPSGPGAGSGNPAGALASADPGLAADSYKSAAAGPGGSQPPAPFPAPFGEASTFSGRFQDALDTGDSQTIDNAIASILPAWVAADPMGALKFASDMEHGDRRDMILNRVIGFWAMKDPAAALQAASKWADPEEGRRLLAAVCLQQAQNDPRDALSAAESVGLGHKAHDPPVEEQLFGRLVRKDASAALGFALSQKQGDWRDRLVQMAAVEQGATNPFGAAQTVLAQIPPGDHQDAAMRALLSQFGGTSITVDSPQGDSTAIQLLQLWAQRNPNAAAAWIQQLPQDCQLYARASAVVQPAPR